MAVINNNYLKGMAFRRKDCFDSFGVSVEDEIESVSYVGPKASNEFSDVAAKIIRIRELFIKKIVKSNNFNIYTLDFDIKKGRKILWDLLVLSEIVKYEINNMGPEAVLAFEESLERKKLYTETSKKEAVRINSFDAKNLKSLQTADGIQMTSDEIVQYLLDAVCILDSLRNSFGHNNAGQKCYLNKDRVFIKNDDPKNTLDFSMDFIYLAEFGTGIVVKEEHSHILKRVNAVYLHLCDYLNFRSRDTITLLDRMTSRNLKILLKYVNNDFTKLLDLPDILFSANLTEERFDALEKLIGIDNFKYVPTYVVDYDFDLKKLETLIKIVGNDVKNLSHLSVALFFQPFDLKKVNVLIDLVGGYKNLKYLPASMFSARCSKELFDLLEDYIGDSKDEELINKLKKFKKDVPTNLLVKKGATNLIFKILAEKKRFNGEGEITFEDFHRFSNLFSSDPIFLFSFGTVFIASL